MPEAAGSRTMKQDWAVVREVFLLARRLNPWAYVTMIALQVLESLIPLVNVILPALILNELVGSQNWLQLRFFVMFTVGINLVAQVARRALLRVRLFHRDSFSMKTMLELAKATVNMAYEHAENPETQMRRQKIWEGTNYWGGVASVIGLLCQFFQGMLSAVLSLGIISQLLLLPSVGGHIGLLAFVDSPWAALMLVLLIVGSLVLNMRNNKTMNLLTQELLDGMMSGERDFFHICFNVIRNYRLGQDIRLYRMQDMLTEQVIAHAVPTRKLHSRIQAAVRKLLAHNQAASALVTTAIYCYVALKVMVGAAPVGHVLLYVGAIAQFNAGCASMITHYATLRFQISLNEETINYLKLPLQHSRGALSVEFDSDSRHVFEFRNVSFHYPGSDMYVLKNITMKVDFGARIAIVGMNGSGKTTLIKLLCRLYEPSEGEVLLNGVDVREYALDEYWSLISVVFQDFRLFSLPIGQNVAAAVDYNTDQALRSLKQAGFEERMRSMPQGLDTFLYSNISDDGIEISGGEAQKIAIARAHYKDAALVILDEPTASLDPISEAEIYSQLNEIIGGKTALFISHRLSSCRFCQEIVVLHEGTIVQQGAHNQLLSNSDGMYAKLWNAQAQYYTQEE